MTTQIETYSGKMIDLLDPNPTDIVLEDIAYSLAGMYRFTAHARYPVAMHSLHTSLLVPEKFAADALMHDAHEAYIGDASSPLKVTLRKLSYSGKSSLDVLDDKWKMIIAGRFNLSHPQPQEVHNADMVALATERGQYMQAQHPWKCLDGIEPDDCVLADLTADKVMVLFLKRADQLGLS